MNTEQSLDDIIDNGCIRIADDLRSSWKAGGQNMTSLYEILSNYEYEEILNEYGNAIYRIAENRLFNALLVEVGKIRADLEGNAKK